MTQQHEQNPNILMLNAETYPGTVLKYAWPGGYPIFYLTKDSGVLCPGCVEEDLQDTQCCGEHAVLDPENASFYVVAHDANWEDPNLYCDHCSERIKSAYAEE